ncbi:MAG: nucleotide sugar dehydrogenase [Nanobdellota archaeon]
MKITMVGTGYVGLVSGTCFADMGNDVICLDIDKEKVDKLSKGEIPIYEPGLKELVDRNLKEDRLAFTDDKKKAVQESDIIFISVGTPQDEKGDADLKYVFSVAEDIAENINGYKVIVDKSTVPVGTAEKVKRKIREKNPDADFDVVSNPEFLREGAAIKDFRNPDRVVIGCDSEKAKTLMEKLYRSVSRVGRPVMFTDVKSSELIKYASNAMLATRISFMNELSHLCEKIGADIKHVSKGMGLDPRIGPRFLQAGIGYGGSCLKGEETVIVKEDGMIRPVPIKDIGDKKGIEILSFDTGKKKPVFRKVKNFTRRKFKGNIVEVKTRMNKTVRVTDDHPMIVDDFNVKLAGDLTLKDKLPSLSGFPRTESLDKLDLIDMLDKDLFDFDKVKVRPKKGKFTKERLKGNFSADRLGDIVRSNCMNLTEFLSVEENYSRGNMLLFTAKGKASYVPTVIDLDSDFMRLLGYYISEGHINTEGGLRGTRKRITVSFNMNEKEYIDDIKKIYDRLKINYTVSDYKENNTTSITTSSRILAYLLEDHLGCGRDSYTADVPDVVFNSPYKMDFLRALFRGDGHVAFPKDTNSVVYDFGSISYDLVHKSILLLLSEGIVPSYKTSRSTKSTGPAHFFRVSTKKQVEKLPGFKDRRTQKKVADVLKGCKDIKSVGFSRKKGACFTEISELNKRYEETDVYSVEVEGTEKFFTSHGILVHNCFPKDVRALSQSLEKEGLTSNIIRAVDYINERQKKSIVPKLKKMLGDLDGKKIALWGLSFKPRTDDIREAPSLVIIDQLKNEFAEVSAFDPEAMDNVKQAGVDVELVDNKYDALKDADALIIVTEWDEFRQPDFERMKKLMKKPNVLDGRNIYDPEEMEGFNYLSVGRSD